MRGRSQNTTFGVHVAAGGGGGGSYTSSRQGLQGGCGGGASGYGIYDGDAGIATQGQPGALGGWYGGGGGGGTALPGVKGTNNDGGSGGGGIYSMISGSPAYYGGGGGGAAYQGVGGAGGFGGGGEGEGRYTSYGAMPGEPNTGGGGGGGNGYKGNGYGAKGGSGVVIIRYLVDAPYIEPYPGGELTETSIEARVNLLLAGIAKPTLTVYWDTVDHGLNPLDWPNSASVAADQPGIYGYTITGLNPDTDYYYIWRAANDYGEMCSRSRKGSTRGKYYYVDPAIAFLATVQVEHCIQDHSGGF